MVRKILIVFCAVLFVISNLTGFKEISGINNGYYKYSNDSGTITVHEVFHDGRKMQKTFSFQKAELASYQQRYPGNTDTIMFRLFEINPLKFWRWGEYIFDWRYKLPFKDWAEIKKRRGYELKYSNNLQAF